MNSSNGMVIQPMTIMNSASFMVIYVEVPVDCTCDTCYT